MVFGEDLSIQGLKMAKLVKFGTLCIHCVHRGAHCFLMGLRVRTIRGFGKDLSIIPLKMAKLAKLGAQCIQSGHRVHLWGHKYNFMLLSTIKVH